MSLESTGLCFLEQWELEESRNQTEPWDGMMFQKRSTLVIYNSVDWHHKVDSVEA